MTDEIPMTSVDFPWHPTATTRRGPSEAFLKRMGVSTPQPIVNVMAATDQVLLELGSMLMHEHMSWRDHVHVALADTAHRRLEDAAASLEEAMAAAKEQVGQDAISEVSSWWLPAMRALRVFKSERARGVSHAFMYACMNHMVLTATAPSTDGSIALAAEAPYEIEPMLVDRASYKIRWMLPHRILLMPRGVHYLAVISKPGDETTMTHLFCNTLILQENDTVDVVLQGTLLAWTLQAAPPMNLIDVGF